MRKAVFFDIDGTLWDGKMQIPASTITAVRAIRANGNYAFICSGRSRSNISDERLLEIGFDGIIAGCGTHVEMNGQIIFEQLLSKEQLQFVLQVLDAYHMHAVLEGPVYTYIDAGAFPQDPYVMFLRKTLGDKVKEISREPDAVHEVNKMSAEIKGEQRKEVLAQLEKEFDIIVHPKGVTELVPKGFSKATGIEKVCEYLRIDVKDTYAFGDSANDLEMLEFVGNGIAMGNGTEDVKEIADYVTTDIMEDGIRSGLEHFGLI